MRFLVCAFLAIATIHATKACTPGEKQEDGPNTCFCLGDGLGWVCAPGGSSPLAIPRSELLRAKRQVEESNDSCEPGTFFRSYCNSCRCADNGKVSSSICTLKGCLGDIWNEDGSLKNPEEITDKSLFRQTRDVEWSSRTCEPGTVFKFFCNNCKCGNDGLVSSAACTRMFCNPLFWNEDGTPRILPMIPGMEINPLSRQTRNVEKSSARCVPGSSFKYFCNDCSCLEDGLLDNASCSRMLCTPGEYNEDGSRNWPEEDNTNTQVAEDLDDSNERFLDPTPVVGGRHAEEVATAPQTGRCVPGTSFKEYCNSCTCPEDGLLDNASCTRMLCNRNAYNEDGSRKYPEEDDTNKDNVEPDDSNDPNRIYFPSFQKREAEEGRCRTGEIFRNYCNYCFCGTDGTIAGSPCTEMACDPEVWNKNGTKKSAVALLRNERSHMEK